jgi:hypothetical protein
MRNQADPFLLVDIIGICSQLISKLILNSEEQEDKEVLKKVFEVLNINFGVLTTSKPNSLLGGTILEGSQEL